MVVSKPLFEVMFVQAKGYSGGAEELHGAEVQ